MKRPYSSRTRASRAACDPVRTGTRTKRTCPRSAGPRSKGSVTVTVLLLTVVFSGLCLAMLHASGVHMKINAFRKISALLDCASESGLKRGLQDLTEWLERTGLLAPVTDERMDALRADPGTAFPLLLEEALGSSFPRILEESFDGMVWESRADCGLGGLEDRGGYFRVAAGLRIQASGGLLRAKPRRVSALEGSIGLLVFADVPPYIERDGRERQASGEKADRALEG